MNFKRLFLAFSFALLSTLCDVTGSATDDDLLLTYDQKLAFDKFKARVIPILPHSYMKDDVYLIRWLRAKDFNVNEAIQFLKDDLRWRKFNGLDKIHKEDWSDMEEQFPVYVDTYDKNGAPVITATAGKWNLRNAHITGQAARLHRFLFKIMDEASMKVREAQYAGKNVTRFHFLLNLDGFNLVEHGCPRCINGILDFIRYYENHFPGMTDQIVLLNAPPTVQLLRPIVVSAISRRTHAHIKLFGTNKKEYRDYLLQFIDADELPEEFGGNRVRQY